VPLAIATNVLAALTGCASGGPTIALDALGGTYLRNCRGGRHRSRAVAPHSRDRRRHARQFAAKRCRGSAARRVRLDPVIALAAVIALGSLLRSF
jgi:hypothetical protein